MSRFIKTKAHIVIKKMHKYSQFHQLVGSVIPLNEKNKKVTTQIQTDLSKIKEIVFKIKAINKQYEKDELLQKYKVNKLPSKNVINSFTKKETKTFEYEKYLDLHDHTLQEAFNAVSHFFINCKQNRIRNVLIITGGSKSRDCVIRRNFKMWIEDNFKDFVIKYSTAKPPLGGDGAFYVILKK